MRSAQTKVRTNHPLLLAAAAEIERLRADMLTRLRQHEEATDALESAHQENERLRAELAQRGEVVAITTKGHLAAMENGYSRFIVGRDPRFAICGENDVPLYAAPQQRTQPLKERPDFIAGYDAGLSDGRRCAERDAAEAPQQRKPHVNPAPGYCKHCKQYTVEEPLPSEQQREPASDALEALRFFCSQHLPAKAWLDSEPLFAAVKAAPQQREPLTEEQALDCIREAGCGSVAKLTYDSGPYEVTKLSIFGERLIRAVEAAHDIKEKP